MYSDANLAQCVKSVCIRSFSGPYSVQMLIYTDQKNSKYGHFSRSGNKSVINPVTSGVY